MPSVRQLAHRPMQAFLYNMVVVLSHQNTHIHTYTQATPHRPVERANHHLHSQQDPTRALDWDAHAVCPACRANPHMSSVTVCTPDACCSYFLGSAFSLKARLTPGSFLCSIGRRKQCLLFVRGRPVYRYCMGAHRPVRTLCEKSAVFHHQ